MFKRSFELLQNALEEKAFPCAAAAIGRNDTVLGIQCVGRISYEKDAAECTPDTLFDLASLTKVVAATTVTLKLMEQGRLSLEDALSDFYEIPKELQGVKLRHLLTHTSGIPAHFLLQNRQPCKDAADMVLSHPLAYETGSRTEYSCMGFILLGSLLERVTGMSLKDLAEQEVFKPLSMMDTGYLPDRSCAPTEMSEDGCGYLNGVVHDENARFLGGVSGNAGVFSSLNDMIRFAQMLACRGILDGKRYLQERTLEIAVKNYTCGLSEHRGLGFKRKGGASDFMGDLFHGESFGHTGFTGTSLAIDPVNGLFVVLLTNRVHPTRENTALIRFRRLFHNCVAAEFAGLNAIPAIFD